MTSKLIVNSIRHTGASADAITMDASGNVTFPANATCSGTATGFGVDGITMADTWRLHTEYTIPHNSTTIVSTANWERPDVSNDGFNQLGTGMSVNSSDHAAGLWTFPSTGYYLISLGAYCYNGSNDAYEVFLRMEFTENGSNFGVQSRVYISGERYNYNGGYGQMLVDVTDTSTQKFRLRVYSAVSDSRLHGDTNGSRQYLNFMRLGDT